MKGAQQTIPVVMTVIIAISLLVLGFNILQRVEGGIDDIEKSGETQQQRFLNIQSLAQACSDWTTGDKYNALAILETYELPLRMLPYEDVSDECGYPLGELARDCLAGDTGGDCVGSGYIDSASSEITDCTLVCSNIRQIFEMCEVSCSENIPQCFEALINKAGSSIDNTGSLGFDSDDVEEACE